ncbi:hypothetical protein [Paenibacillus sp. GYB003]|uniref:hypothetical protein n=1 Tax=Paenibacillus sp. GYB003 TaxID=2994392 RepID=UPI002F96D478
MEKNEHHAVNRSDVQNKTNDAEVPIVLDGKATVKAPSDPSLTERTKQFMEDLGTEINSV